MVLTDEGLKAKKSWGVVERYNVFDTTPTSQKAEYKIFTVKLINEVKINSVLQPFTDAVDMLAVRIFGLQRKKNQATQDAFQYREPSMRFGGLGHFKSHWFSESIQEYS